MEEYSIEKIRDKFKEYANEFDEHYLSLKQEIGIEKFNIHRAFLKFCEEIIELKRKIE